MKTIRNFKEIENENNYPNIYFDAVLTTDIRDSQKSFIYPSGCTNLLNESNQNINCDWEHESYYANGRIQKSEIKNAGVLMSLKVEIVDNIDQLVGSFRIGKEHNLVDKNGKVYGSSYGSAWLMYATEKVNKTGGNVDDYIPEYIKNEFIKPNTVAKKSVSVEVDYGAYPTENFFDMNKNLHIHKFDLVTVTFLTHSPPGQSQSKIKQNTVEIRSKSNYNNMSNTTTIRCLCDFSSLHLGQYLYDSATDEMYKVVSGTEKLGDDTTKTYTIENIITGVQDTKTLDEFKANETLDSVWTDRVLEFVIAKILPLINDKTAVRSFQELGLPSSTLTLIRMCQKCQEKTLIKAADPEVKAEPEIGEIENEKEKNDTAQILESLEDIKNRLSTLETNYQKEKDLEKLEDEQKPEQTNEIRSFKSAVIVKQSAMDYKITPENTENNINSALTLTL